jgi:hypothetical protein
MPTQFDRKVIVKVSLLPGGIGWLKLNLEPSDIFTEVLDDPFVDLLV